VRRGFSVLRLTSAHRLYGDSDLYGPPAISKKPGPNIPLGNVYRSIPYLGDIVRNY
jgi:hypothetical protein